jgi:hypothetical protein
LVKFSGLFSLLFGLVAVVYTDYQAVADKGFFQVSML